MQVNTSKQQRQMNNIQAMVRMEEKQGKQHRMQQSPQQQ